MARYTASGRIDTSFGSNGSVTLETTHGIPIDVLVSPDHALLVVVSYGVWRLSPSGSIDRNFGDDGFAHPPSVYCMDLQSGVMFENGGIVVAGDTDCDAQDGNVYVVRFRSRGQLDRSFGSGGVASFSPGSTPSKISVEVESSSKVVVAAYDSVARFTVDGSLDRSFGDNAIASGRFLNPQAVVIQNDDKVLLLGSEHGRSRAFAVSRLTREGRRDTTFSGDGTVVTAFPGRLAFSSAGALDARGRIVVVGYSSYRRGDFALARYER